MPIERDERSLLLHGPFQDERVVSPCLARLESANNIMTGVLQKRRQFDSKHLIEVNAHRGLRRIKGGDFRVQDGVPGVMQSSLNILPRQFRVAAQQGIPRFIAG
jgi:hypothetical protein